jgi:hypothetical protein
VARSTTPVRAAMQAAAFAAGVLAALMLSGAVKPVELLAPARTGQGSEVILEDFGAEGIRARTPFDGQYIYVTARLLPDLDAISEQIYEADYRLVRILHPVLASPAAGGTPTILALQLWNLVGVALFAGALADLLRRHGQDPSWAVGATLAACALPLLLTTSEPLAFGLGMAGLCTADRRRVGWAIALLALAGLTRESALTFAAAAAVLAWSRGRRWGSLGLLAASIAPTALWWAYVQSITPTSRTPVAPLGILEIGTQPWDEKVVSLMMLALIAVSVVAWWDVPPLRWVALAFAAWLPLYESFAFKLVGLPRLSSPSLALAVVALLRWRARDRDGAALTDRATTNAIA